MSSKVKAVYAIQKKDGQEKATWIRVGSAFDCKDNSINVILDAVPLTGSLNIREVKERSKETRN